MSLEIYKKHGEIPKIYCQVKGRSQRWANSELLSVMTLASYLLDCPQAVTEILTIVAAKRPGVSEGTDKMFDKYWKV